MNTPVLSDIDIQEKVCELLTNLGPLPRFDALVILHRAQERIYRDASGELPPELSEPVSPINPNLITPAHPSVFDQRPEIAEYIQNIDEKLTISELTHACQRRFGKIRGLSRTNIGRYRKKLNSQARRRSRGRHV